MLAALGLVKEQTLKETLILGELGLDGSVHPVRGVLPAVLFAREQGFGRCLVPVENVREGELVEGIACVGTKSLMEAVELLNHPEQMRPVKGDYEGFLENPYGLSGGFCRTAGTENSETGGRGGGGRDA